MIAVVRCREEPLSTRPSRQPGRPQELQRGCMTATFAILRWDGRNHNNNTDPKVRTLEMELTFVIHAFDISDKPAVAP